MNKKDVLDWTIAALNRLLFWIEHLESRWNNRKRSKLSPETWRQMQARRDVLRDRDE
jgi:hypothetical protein